MTNRTRERTNASLEVDAVIGDRIIQSETRNISAAGVMIKTKMRFRPGEDARLVFAVPGPNGARPVKLRARTVRNDDRGVSLQFVGVSPNFADFLDEALQNLRDYPCAA